MARNKRSLAALGVIGVFLAPTAATAVETETKNLDNSIKVAERVVTVDWENEVPNSIELIETPSAVEVPEEPQLVVEVVQEPTPPPVEVPSVPANGSLLGAALAQLGAVQDCTDLVQNSLAAIGLSTRRDSGGYDMGVWDFVNVGYQIDPSQAQPGDIAITHGHVWIISDVTSGVGVHGGFGGMNTVHASNGVPISSHTIIRVA